MDIFCGAFGLPASILEIFPYNGYFNSDSLIGFNGKYKKINSESYNFLDRAYIQNKWQEYINLK